MKFIKNFSLKTVPEEGSLDQRLDDLFPRGDAILVGLEREDLINELKLVNFSDRVRNVRVLAKIQTAL